MHCHTVHSAADKEAGGLYQQRNAEVLFSSWVDYTHYHFRRITT